MRRPAQPGRLLATFFELDKKRTEKEDRKRGPKKRTEKVDAELPTKVLIRPAWDRTRVVWRFPLTAYNTELRVVWPRIENF